MACYSAKKGIEYYPSHQVGETGDHLAKRKKLNTMHCMVHTGHCSQEADLQGQRVNEWLLLGGRWGMRNGYGASFWGDENGLKPDSADGCKTLNTYKK